MNPDRRAHPGSLGGFTLIEAMVVAGLFLAVLTVVTVVMTMGTRWVSRIRAQQGSHGDLTVCAANISKRLAEAPEGGLTVHYPSGVPATGDLLLAFQSARATNGSYQEKPDTFEPIYQGSMVFRREGPQLRRSFVASASPSTAIAPGVPAVLIAAMSNDTTVVLAREVAGFWALNPDDDKPTDRLFNPFRFRLEIGKGDRDTPTPLGITCEVRLIR